MHPLRGSVSIHPPIERRRRSAPKLQKSRSPTSTRAAREPSMAAWSSGACEITRTYHPSPGETVWREHGAELTDETPLPKRACQWMKNKSVVASIVEWISVANRRRRSPATVWREETFSHFLFTNSCSPVTRRVPIEPLVSRARRPNVWPQGTPIHPAPPKPWQIAFLRHPYYNCYRRYSSMLDTKYLVPLWQEEIAPPRTGRGSLRIFFDLGAALFNGLPGTTQPGSLKYFLREYSSRGILFDRCLAWEAVNYNDTEIRKPLPARFKRSHQIFREPPTVFSVQDATALSYFNYPVDAAPQSPANPLALLSTVASISDFVVVKLDIDAPVIERAMIEQILTTPALSSLIDELYWEHHVLRSPMMHGGWESTRPRPTETLQDSHRLFGRLRQLGIRAHSWV